MLWLIIFPLVFAVCAYKFNRNSYYSVGVRSAIGWAVLYAAISLIPATFLAALIGHLLPGEERVVRQLEIIALADATHTDGQFYLFGGHIDAEPVYRYYYDTGKGYKMGWKPVRDSLIVESETETPRYDRIDNVRDGGLFNIPMTHETRYIFYVPPGTVTNDFNLDLEG